MHHWVSNSQPVGNESSTISTSIGLPLEKKLKPLSLLRQMLHQYHGGRDWSISQTNLDCFDEFCVNLSAHQLGQCCFYLVLHKSTFCIRSFEFLTKI